LIRGHDKIALWILELNFFFCCYREISDNAGAIGILQKNGLIDLQPPTTGFISFNGGST
jgi:hypothetical protein